MLKRIKLLAAVLLSLGITGCASYGVIENQEKTDTASSILPPPEVRKAPDDQITIVLAFSGGGSRAAALSYGILQSLNNTQIPGTDKQLLDEVDTISSVSGGSITAAYYGLYGKQIFEQFPTDVLNVNHEEKIIDRASSFKHLTSNKGRSETAVEYFDETLFRGHKIGQFKENGTTNIIINTSDLGGGARLSFTPEYFALLCSDVKNFPVARAVIASAAVPLIFNPIVVQNFDSCGTESPQWLQQAKRRLANDPEMSLVIDKLESFSNKEQRKYIHLVDGGITDNLGLRALYETVELAGGAPALRKSGHADRQPQTALVIVVDASTTPPPKMDQSLEEPSLADSINAVTDIQIHRYNAATLKLFENKLSQWGRELGEPRQPLNTYLVKVRLQNILDETERAYYNAIPTSLALTADQSEALINIADKLLQADPSYQKFMHQLQK